MNKVIVTLDYSDLQNQKLDLNEVILEAFGTRDCLGVCFVRGVPELEQMRAKLLNLASKLAKLDATALKEVTTEYAVGWSHGRELMNGFPDLSKGSFYANPTMEDPSLGDDRYKMQFPHFGTANLWPDQLPDLQESFCDLGSLIVTVGISLAVRCDLAIASSTENPRLLETLLTGSRTHKGRLLHYFPQNASSLEKWCGRHVDNSVLTGLTAGIFIDETNGIPVEGPASSGLYISLKDGSDKHIEIPVDCLAFQIGECAQVASNGRLVATSHYVAGGNSDFVSRNTFAVFLQPNTTDEIKKDLTFAQFSDQVFSRHE